MKPIAISVSGGFLDFEGSIRFKLTNPMFAPDSVIGISVFPFDIPGTPNNKKLLKFFNLAEDVQNIDTIDATIYLYGNIFVRGGLKFTWVQNSFEALFSQIMSLSANKDSFLKTVTLDSYDLNNQSGYSLMYDYIKDRSLDSWAGTKDIVFFPQYNPSFFNNKDLLKATPTPYPTPSDTLIPDLYLQYLNYWDYHESDTGNPEIIDFWFWPNGSPDRTNEFAMSPSYYVKNLLQKLFKENGFDKVIGSDFFDVADIDKLVITSDKFFRMRVNYTSPGGTPTFTPSFLDFTDFIFRQSDYLPDIKIFDFLLAIKNTFNLSFFFGLVDQTVEIRHNETLLADEAYEEWTHKCFLLHEKERNTEESNTFKYTRSDDQINDTNSLKGRTILPSVFTYSSLPAVGDRDAVCLVTDENNYYEQEYNISGTLEWKLYSQENTDLEIIGAIERESYSDTWHVAIQEDQIEGLASDNITPLGVTAYNGKKMWRLPIGEFSGNSTRFRLKEKGKGYTRFLFYRGMQEYFDHYNNYITGSTTATYPFATNNEVDPLGFTIGDLSLLWTGDLGLYNMWWSKWLELINTKTIIRRALVLTVNDILNFNYKKKKMIDGVKYFVKEGDVVVSNAKGIEPAVFDFIRINYNANGALAPSYTRDWIVATGLADAAIIAALAAIEAYYTEKNLIDYNNPSNNKIIALYLYAGGTAAMHKLNFLDARDLDAAYRIDWSGGVTHGSNGITGNSVNGTGDTHYIPSDYGDEIAVFSYNRTSGNDAGPDLVAYHSSGTSITDIFAKWTDSKTYYSANATAEDDLTGMSATGLLLSTSEGATTQRLYRNGASVDSASKTLGKPDRSIRILGMSGIGFTGRNSGASGICKELNSTEAADLYTGMQAYQTAMSRQV